MRIFIAATLLVLATGAYGQHQVLPAQPTTADYIRYKELMNSSCERDTSAVVNGHHITIIIPESPGLCFSVIAWAIVDIGQLPAGQYDLDVSVEPGSPWAYTFTDSFVVAQAIEPPGLPMLDGRAMALLLGALGAAGVFAIRR